MNKIEFIKTHNSTLECRLLFRNELNYQDLIERLLKINPLDIQYKKMEVSGLTDNPIPFYYHELMGYLLNDQDFISTYTILSEDKRITYSIFKNVHRAVGGCVNVILKIEQVKELDTLLNQIKQSLDILSNEFPFINGYIFDPYFVGLESDDHGYTRYVNNIQDPEFEKLKHTDDFGSDLYDIRKNYGRIECIWLTWVMASWIVIEGLEYAKLFSKMKFPSDTVLIEDRGNYIIAKLYDNPFDSYTSVNYLKLKKYRELNGIDSMEQSLPKYIRPQYWDYTF